MEERVALVTGASSGIGRAIALALAKAGLAVGVNYHSGGARARDVVREIEEAGSRGTLLQGNVASPADVERMVGELADRFGRLDVLVNNAGIEQPAPLLDLTEAQWDVVLDVNLKGAFLCAQAAARRMIAGAAGGRIVNLSSVHEDLAMPGNTPYVCAKGGMRMLTRNLALELAPHRIAVVAVGPGAIRTPMNEHTLEDPELLTALRTEIPLRRVGSAEEVADLVAYLVSEQATYITGTTVFIDGGLMRSTGTL